MSELRLSNYQVALVPILLTVPIGALFAAIIYFAITDEQLGEMLPYAALVLAVFGFTVFCALRAVLWMTINDKVTVKTLLSTKTFDLNHISKWFFVQERSRYKGIPLGTHTMFEIKFRGSRMYRLKVSREQAQSIMAILDPSQADEETHEELPS